MADLLKALKQQRGAMRDLAAGREVAALVATENFDREAARRVLDARIEALRAAGPALVDAAGDFFEALDFDQQQAVRFLLRRLRRRGMASTRERDHGDHGDHDEQAAR